MMGLKCQYSLKSVLSSLACIIRLLRAGQAGSETYHGVYAEKASELAVTGAGARREGAKRTKGGLLPWWVRKRLQEASESEQKPKKVTRPVPNNVEVNRNCALRPAIVPAALSCVCLAAPLQTCITPAGRASVGITTSSMARACEACLLCVLSLGLSGESLSCTCAAVQAQGRPRWDLHFFRWCNWSLMRVRENNMWPKTPLKPVRPL